jgi:hypothetical protein
VDWRLDLGLDERAGLRNRCIVKDLDAMTVSKADQGTLPTWRGDASGLFDWGVAPVRLARDRRNSIALTSKPAERRGAAGLLKLFSC